jgi:hypothetical protein
MLPFAILGAFVLIPVLLAHAAVVVFWAFRLKRTGRYNALRLSVFGCLSGAMVFVLLTAWGLSGYQELQSSGQAVIDSGSFTPSAYVAIFLACGVGALWGALASLGFHRLLLLINGATSNKT